MSLYNPQYKDGQGNLVDLPINAKKLDGYSYNEYSKYYTTSSTTANAFLVTIPYVKALSDGLVIHCQFHAATKSGATLNVNNLGAKGIYYRYATAITTHIVANNYVDLIYSAPIDKWVLLFSYDSNSNYLGYQVRTNNGSYYNSASTSCYRYQILVETTGGLEAFTSTSNSTGTSKKQLSPKYIPNGTIRYYSGTSTIASKDKFSATALWQQYQGINLKYSFNISTITTDSPCYIKMSRNTDGTLSPVYSATSGGHPLVFALPTTKDGYYYTYLGRTYTSSSVVYLELELCHPTFYYDGGIRVYDGTYLYDWAKASTKPTYTASEVGALPDTTTIPTKTSDLTNDRFVRYDTNAQGLTDTQKTNARTNIGAGTSNFTGYTSSNKLSTDYIDNKAGWTSNKGTVTSIRVQAGTGLSSSTSTASTTTLDTTISIASGYKLLTTNEYNTLNNKVSNVQSDWNATSGAAQILNKPTLSTVATSGSYNDLTNKPSIFSFTRVISTQTITIKNLQTGVYLLTYNGTKKLKTAIGEVSNHELILETTTTYNNILIANRYTITSGDKELSYIQWKLVCPYSNSTLYKGITYQAESSSNTTYWTGYVYQERFINEGIYTSSDASSSDTNYYYPLYRDTELVTDTNTGQRKDQYTLLKTGPKYAGGTSVTLNGTNKSANTAYFYAPESSGKSGQFLKSSGSGAPTWTSLSTVATSGSYNDLTNKPSSETASSGGTDLSLVTTGEKYTWNNKQDKISSLGSTTKPIYFSSNGVASECSTYAGGTAVTLNGTSKSATTASFYAPESVGTNGQLLSSNGSSLVWTNDNRGLLHHDLNVEIPNTTTDSGWSMFNSTYNGYLLKSVRFNANSPAWGVGNYGSGIVFGGVDTKGVVSVAYGTPEIKFAGGNGSGPRWWIGLTGTSGTTYNLDDKQDKISALGSTTKPIYFSSDGVVSACLNYGGGTKVTLNGTEHKGTNATMYAPTTAGTSGYSLKSNGSGAPRWANEAAVQLSGSLSAGAKNNASITLVITNTSKPLKKGVWRYSGTHGVFLIFAPNEITTMGSPRTAYICGYVSSQISNNTSLTLVEV